MKNGVRQRKVVPECDTVPTKLCFDDNAEIYSAQACCQLIHYRVAAIIVAVLEGLVLFGLLALLYKYVNQIQTTELAIIGIILGIGILSVISLLAGVFTYRSFLIQLHMFYQLFIIGIGIILTIIAVISMAGGLNWANAVFGWLLGPAILAKVSRVLGPIWPFCLAVIFDFGAALCMWFYVLVRGANDFVKDRNFFTENKHHFYNNEMRNNTASATSTQSGESIEMASSSNSSTIGQENKDQQDQV